MEVFSPQAIGRALGDRFYVIVGDETFLFQSYLLNCMLVKSLYNHKRIF